ncbi:MAG: nucleotidyltransferase domain-containing protein [Candidatus Choladocola sp.]|nr:nucleotidyltransferase domain-containing protein [Candidatus Choladocola sp.]
MLNDLALNNDKIQAVKEKAADRIKDLMKGDLVEIVLYGSCARGDYTDDSDVDIAIITKCDRMGAKKYSRELAGLATELAMEYFVVVNFVCLPYEEYITKNNWYEYFRNIRDEGERLYG